MVNTGVATRAGQNYTAVTLVYVNTAGFNARSDRPLICYLLILLLGHNHFQKPILHRMRNCKGESGLALWFLDPVFKAARHA